MRTRRLISLNSVEKHMLNYTVQSFINIFYFFIIENGCEINMETSKTSRSSTSQYTTSLYKIYDIYLIP